jgi:16S rRNA (guanine1207-N2)-methyltransferase
LTNHYYNNNLETKSNKRLIKEHILNHELSFITDHGVFSKGGIDYGSKVLIENCPLDMNYKFVLDIGCGYGPIGISLAKEFSHIHFDLVDVNIRALDLARKNATLNNLQNISVFESNIYEMINTKYDCIISNPPIRAGKKVVYQILNESDNYLEVGGMLCVVMQKKYGAKSAIDNLQQVYGNCSIVCRDRGYYVFRSIKK